MAKDNRLKRIYINMKDRCNNPKNRSYKHYGEKGISICKDWLDFELFEKWSYENGYDDTLTIDRKSCAGNYCPQNCRWIPLAEQSRNRTSNIIFEHDGKNMIMADWARELNISINTLYQRKKAGKSIERILFSKKYSKNKPITV